MMMLVMMVVMVMVTTRKCNGDGNDAEVVITNRNGIDDGDDGDGDDDDGDDDEYDDLWRFPFRDHRGAPGGVGTP